jgi:hypothetical protein
MYENLCKRIHKISLGHKIVQLTDIDCTVDGPMFTCIFYASTFFLLYDHQDDSLGKVEDLECCMPNLGRGNAFAYCCIMAISSA